MDRLRRLRGMLLVAVGLVTPLGVLAVNLSAFIMQHLTEFRVTITVCALLSALVLNGLTAWWALRYAERTATPLFTEYRTQIIVLAVVAVLVSAAISTYLTSLGMRDPKHLPDKFSVLGSLFALILPFVFTYIQRRMARRNRGRQPGPDPDEPARIANDARLRFPRRRPGDDDHDAILRTQRRDDPRA